eukprot:CAMPEP_0201096594 /NCGR_PEP_ID=MMETSP0812-20130820/5602_1 /ASSEMBLY_ACC=CAM_ASM_000668 /TAXON_ID=98059 /ORGANISM="Dinobryon sp., Strain UTEXLB2267" /LENGTH=200 /DNA_ID=CAMNT_0047350967 /DNA_START=335 /DNA_END=937 /DNA_ORIENTATION=+
MISRGQTYRIVTPLFLHGSLPHLLMNSFSLKELGPQTEKTFGTTRFLILYFASGIIANIATYLIGVSPYSLGASGSIFGLMGGFAAFYIKNKQVLGRFSDAGLQSIMRNLMANLLYGMYANNIDTWAHLGGFAGGAVVSFIIAPKLKRLKTGRFVEIKSHGNNNLLSYLQNWRKPRAVSDQSSRILSDRSWSEYGDLSQD